MGIQSAKRTDFNTLKAGNTGIRIQINNAVDSLERTLRASIGTGRLFALAAYHRHTEDGLRIGGDHADGSFFRVIDLEMLNGADEFANSAP
jgi:hypothetical protein